MLLGCLEVYEGYVCWVDMCKDMCVGKCIKGYVCVSVRDVGMVGWKCVMIVC